MGTHGNALLTVGRSSRRKFWIDAKSKPFGRHCSSSMSQAKPGGWKFLRPTPQKRIPVNGSVSSTRSVLQRRKDMCNRFRQLFLLVCAGLIVLAAISLGACKTDAHLTVVSFGGAYQDAQRVAYMTPFSAKTGTRIQESEYNGEYGLLRQRATASTGAWDVVSVESGPCMRGGEESIFETLPNRVFDGKEL